MTNKQSLEYAQHRLAMAAAVQHKEDIATWGQHVDYWLNKNDKDLKPGDFIPLSPTFYELMRMKEEQS